MGRPPPAQQHPRPRGPGPHKTRKTLCQFMPDRNAFVSHEPMYLLLRYANRPQPSPKGDIHSGSSSLRSDQFLIIRVSPTKESKQDGKFILVYIAYEFKEEIEICRKKRYLYVKNGEATIFVTRQAVAELTFDKGLLISSMNSSSESRATHDIRCTKGFDIRLISLIHCNFLR